MLEANLLSNGSFVAVDIETTGPRPGSASIIDIGAVRVQDGRVVGHLSTLVRPDEPVPPVIQQLTGISTPMVAAAPPVGDAIRALARFAEDAVLVAHGHRFDLSFLDYEAERAWGVPFPRPVLDTLTLARRLHPELPRYNLRDLSVFYGTEARPNHRALPDAMAAAEVLLAMVPELADQGVATIADAARYCGSAGGGRLANMLPLSTNIPDGPGIYCLRDETGAIVFVGRAKNLRTRIRGHFYSVADSDTCPAARTASISYITCCSCLDAELLEARLRRRYSHTLDRQSHRQQTSPVYIHVNTDGAYPSMRVTHRHLETGMLFGPLANEHSARVLTEALASHFALKACRRPARECRTRPCSPSTEARCGAPDVDSVGVEEYRRRVDGAMAVFDGGGPAFREMLQSHREQALREGRVSDANSCRDALRALDRTLATLALSERACSQSVRVFMEADVDEATLIVVANGWRFSAIRCSRADVLSGRCSRRVAHAVSRAQDRVLEARIPTARLQDMVIIENYRQRNDVTWIGHSGDAEDTAERVTAALRRVMRIPRKRHEGVSAG